MLPFRAQTAQIRHTRPYYWHAPYRAGSGVQEAEAIVLQIRAEALLGLKQVFVCPTQLGGYRAQSYGASIP